MIAPSKFILHEDHHPIKHFPQYLSPLFFTLLSTLLGFVVLLFLLISKSNLLALGEALYKSLFLLLTGRHGAFRRSTPAVLVVPRPSLGVADSPSSTLPSFLILKPFDKGGLD